MPGDAEVTQRAGSLRSLTGLTEAEFQALLLSFEQAFVAYRQDRTCATMRGDGMRGNLHSPYQWAVSLWG
jgi:hypothetical protein